MVGTWCHSWILSSSIGSSSCWHGWMLTISSAADWLIRLCLQRLICDVWMREKLTSFYKGTTKPIFFKFKLFDFLWIYYFRRDILQNCRHKLIRFEFNSSSQILESEFNDLKENFFSYSFWHGFAIEKSIFFIIMVSNIQIYHFEVVKLEINK